MRPNVGEFGPKRKLRTRAPHEVGSYTAVLDYTGTSVDYYEDEAEA